MCDYCDCRARWPIEELGEEHARLAVLSHDVRASIAADDLGHAHDVFNELVELLDAHSTKEEEGLFAALRAEHELLDDVTALISDHDGIAALIVDGDSDFPASALEVLHQLEEHIQREEYDLYPATRLALSPAGWDMVEDVHRRQAAHDKATADVV
jgi:hemerythrin-like domain-containing protein